MKSSILSVVDTVISPFVYFSAILLKNMRRIGVQRFPLSKRILLNVGVFPIRDHYYEPMFHKRHLSRPLSEDRDLPGIDQNTDEQLEILESLSFSDELRNTPISRAGELEFFMDNNTFCSGDAEFWYNIVRLMKPKKIVEIGSGYSTLMAAKAIEKNSEENSAHRCSHICIEPFERPWLEKIGASIIRTKVEEVDKDVFLQLKTNDILFIDSSHIIRPQGDVLYEYLALLPILNEGVIVHIHDIFTPKDYLKEWIIDEVKLWNEQYLLEAFLTSNKDWKVIAALNYLHHNHYEKLSEKCPFLTRDREPGSFYIQKITPSK